MFRTHFLQAEPAHRQNLCRLEKVLSRADLSGHPDPTTHHPRTAAGSHRALPCCLSMLKG